MSLGKFIALTDVWDDVKEAVYKPSTLFSMDVKKGQSLVEIKAAAVAPKEALLEPAPEAGN